MPTKSNKKVIEEINIIGLKSNPSFVCTNPNMGYVGQSRRLIEVQCLLTKEKKITRYGFIKRGNNCFISCGGQKRNIDEVISIINKRGLMNKHPFKCSNPEVEFKNRNRLVEIESLITKEKIQIFFNAICRNNNNHFEHDKNLVELKKVHPLYQKLFKKLKIEYKHNFKVGSMFIDFTFRLGKSKKWIGLEVKQSRVWYSKNNQLSKYRQLGSLKQYRLSRVILSDPKGSHKAKGSISIKDLEKFIISQM